MASSYPSYAAVGYGDGNGPSSAMMDTVPSLEPFYHSARSVPPPAGAPEPNFQHSTAPSFSMWTELDQLRAQELEQLRAQLRLEEEQVERLRSSRSTGPEPPTEIGNSYPRVHPGAQQLQHQQQLQLQQHQQQQRELLELRQRLQREEASAEALRRQVCIAPPVPAPIDPDTERELQQLRSELEREETATSLLRERLQSPSPPRSPGEGGGLGSLPPPPRPPPQPQRQLGEEQQRQQQLLASGGESGQRRRQATAERCQWLYLNGSLEGFEVLQPRNVFLLGQEDIPPAPPGGGSAAACPSGLSEAPPGDPFPRSNNHAAAGGADGTAFTGHVISLGGPPEPREEEMRSELAMLYDELHRRAGAAPRSIQL